MSRSRLIIGIGLVLAGVIFLLQSLNVITFGGLVWSLLFAAGGLVFLYFFVVESKNNWWAAIPGMALLGIGATIFISENVADPTGGNLAGAAFMFGLSLGFWLVYIARREQWWAILPAGIILSVAALIAVEGTSFGGGEAGVGIMFLGMALTFLLLYVLVRQPRMTWALIPAGVLGVMAVAFLLASETILRVIGPLALVVVGIFLIFRTVVRKA